MEEATEKLSITHTEIEIIMFLFNNPDYDTAKDISELRKFPKSCVSKPVDDLIKKDYLESFIDISDRRILHLKLKEPSKPVIKLSQKIRTHFLEIICQGIDDREKEELLKILNTISINVKEALKEKC